MDENPAAPARVARQISPRQGSRSRWWLMVRFLLAIALLVLVFRRVDWHQFLVVVSDVRPEWLVVAFIVKTADRLWMAGKWWYLLCQLAVRTSYFDTVRHYYSGGLIGAATQWQLGGDIARAVGLGRSVGQPGMVAASVVFEKVAGLAATGLWAILAAVLLNARWHFWPLGLGLAAAGAAVAVLLCMPFLASSALAPRALARLGQRLPWRMPRRLANEASAILSQFRTSRRAIPIFFLLTLGEQIVPVVVVILLAYALGLSLAPLTVLSVVPISAFISRLPISLEALGLREAIFVYLLGLYGLSAAGALALALATRVMDLVAIGAGALVCAGIAHDRRPDDTAEAPDATSTVSVSG